MELLRSHLHLHHAHSNAEVLAQLEESADVESDDFTNMAETEKHHHHKHNHHHDGEHKHHHHSIFGGFKKMMKKVAKAGTAIGKGVLAKKGILPAH